MSSDHEQLGKVAPGRTMQLDALPDELIDGILEGDDSGYRLADEAGPSAPPPLPPRGASGPPGAAGPPAPAGPPPPAGEPSSNRTMVLAIVVAVLMAVAGVVVGTLVLGEDEAAAPEAPPLIELGDIEVESN